MQVDAVVLGILLEQGGELVVERLLGLGRLAGIAARQAHAAIGDVLQQTVEPDAEGQTRRRLAFEQARRVGIDRHRGPGERAAVHVYHESETGQR